VSTVPSGPREAPDGEGAKEYYLNEKIKAIQKELGRGEKSEFDELKKKIDAAGMTKDAHEKAMAELSAGTDAADVGRIDGLTQLSRLAAGGAMEEEIKEIRDLAFAQRC
jgi:ATP-dependent Lon protease